MLNKTSFFVDQIIQIIKSFIQFTLSLTFWDGIILSSIVILIVYVATRRKKYKLSSINLNLPFSLGNITYETTEEERIIAWKLYTQLKTRKAALIFDEDYDVIVEVYDSLYKLFPIARELLMDLPLYEVERESGIADLILRVQNNGIRPHLTKWQSDFRRWWNNETKKRHNKNRSPQDIQKKYPKYKELVEDLRNMNLELNKYSEDLLNIARSSPKRGIKYASKKPVPTPPFEERSSQEKSSSS